MPVTDRAGDFLRLLCYTDDMTQYTAALVGTGRIGFTLGFDKKREQPASHTMALLKNKQIRLIAGADTDSERLARWQKHVPHAQVFATSDELYAAVHPDIITIAVNEDAHLAECLKAIRAKPRLVILEKPVALNVEQALKIKTCAEENGVPVMVNHERRFARDYNIAANFINRIGDLQMIRADLFSGLRVYSKEKESTGEYSLLHDGTHLVDIVQFLLGSYRQNATEAPEATAPQATPTTPAADIGDTPLLTNPVVTGIHKDEKGDVRNFTAHYTTAICPEVSLSMSGRSKFFAFAIDILGTTGRICIGNGFAKCYVRKESRLYTGFYSLARDKSVRFPKKTGYFANMVQNAVDFLDGTAPLKSPLDIAIADLRVLEEIKGELQGK